MHIPTLIIHGVEDEEIPINHGIALHEHAANPVEPLFIDGVGHNNIEVDARPQLLRRLDVYIRQMERAVGAPVAPIAELPVHHRPVDVEDVELRLALERSRIEQ